MLRQHPSVKGAVTVLHSDPHAEKFIAAFITPSETGLQVENGSGRLTDADKIQGWGEIFDGDTYAAMEEVSSAQAGQDFVGWVRMLDGEVIPRAEMSEWLEDTIRAIKQTGPSGSVVEIGTGTGMILFGLKDELTHYVGLEPASKAVNFVVHAAAVDPVLIDKVDVRLGTATDLIATAVINPDLFVINSVAQYFPSGKYLKQTVLDAISLAHGRPARMFLGDIRSLAVSDEFFTSWAVHQLRKEHLGTFTRTQVRQRAHHLRQTHTELLVDPSFFFDLQKEYRDEISHVEIYPKRMNATNELSQFRYQVVLWFFQPNLRIIAFDDQRWIDYCATSLTVEGLKRELDRLEDDFLPVKNIPNSKLAWERQVLSALDGTSETVWLEKLPQALPHALSPYDLDLLAKKAGLHVELSWARQGQNHGILDAVFMRPRGDRTLFQFPTLPISMNSTTNSPATSTSQILFDLAAIKKFLKAKLPSYMVPSQFQLVSDFPVTANGKIDRQALVDQLASNTAPRDNKVYVAPRSSTEQTIVSVFEEVLGSAQISAEAEYVFLQIDAFLRLIVLSQLL